MGGTANVVSSANGIRDAAQRVQNNTDEATRGFDPLANLQVVQEGKQNLRRSISGAVDKYSDPTREARDKAASLARQSQIDNQNLIDEAKKRKDQQEASATAAVVRSAARARQLAVGGASYGMNSTILTSPLGVPTSPVTGGGKTLLGT